MTPETSPMPGAEPFPEAASPTAPASPLGGPVEIPEGPPQWPTGPRWPTGISARPPAEALPDAPGAADPLTAIMARQVTEAMWAASSRDVVQAPLVPAAPTAPTAAVQPCVSCGISLSATARFCRRCGTSQDANP